MKIIHKDNKTFAQFSKTDGTTILLEDNTFVFVENRLIREGEWYVPNNLRKVTIWKMGNGIHKGKSTYCDVVVASSFHLEGIPLIVVEDELNKLLNAQDTSTCESDYEEGLLEGITIGYKANPNKYTEEQLREAFEEGKQMMFMEMNRKLVKFKSSTEYIKSLNKPKVPDVIELPVHKLHPYKECEIECICTVSDEPIYELKVDSNNQIRI